MVKVRLFTSAKDVTPQFVAEVELRVEFEDLPDAVLWNQRLFTKALGDYHEATVMLAAGSSLIPVRPQSPVRESTDGRG